MAELYKGIFWKIDGELFCIKCKCGADGTPMEDVAFSAKSGANFNHQAEWNKLPRSTTQGKPFDYFPRGRVEVKQCKAIVFLNPTLPTKQPKRK